MSNIPPIYGHKSLGVPYHTLYKHTPDEFIAPHVDQLPLKGIDATKEQAQIVQAHALLLLMLPHSVRLLEEKGVKVKLEQVLPLLKALVFESVQGQAGRTPSAIYRQAVTAFIEGITKQLKAYYHSKVESYASYAQKVHFSLEAQLNDYRELFHQGYAVVKQQ